MKTRSFILFISMIIFVYFGCEDSTNESPTESEQINTSEDIETPDWTEETHGKGIEPNYKIVFPQENVNRLDIKITANDWQIMLDDMTSNYGSFGSSTGGPPQMEFSEDNPVYVPCSLFFNGIEWYKVGIRFKGNSSLRASWQKGIWKIPLRLNFDKFEDDYPAIKNQRFYGFKELSLSSNYDDKSLVREKIVPEIFRDMGVPAPQTCYYRIYIDYGEGEIYFGLYTMVEIVEDTMIKNQFTEANGNVYKPEGDGASFAFGKFNTADFEKKTNEETDWSDVETLYNILNSNLRMTDTESWKNSLEKNFNVDEFLKWLAVNTTVQNWDTYGRMTHNYYLYNNPADSMINWIPWDNNEALQFGKQGGAISISCSEIGDGWPLIRYLLDEEEYVTKYKIYLKQVIDSAFEPSKMITKYQSYQSLIEEYVIGTNGEIGNHTFLSSDADFTAAISDLISHVNSRYQIVNDYIN